MSVDLDAIEGLEAILTEMSQYFSALAAIEVPADLDEVSEVSDDS